MRARWAAPAPPLIVQRHPSPITPGVSISGAEQGGVGAAGSNVITLAAAPVITRISGPSGSLTITVRTTAGQQRYRLTPALRVLGRGGQELDRTTLRVGDLLVRQGSTVQDESADAVTLSGEVAPVEGVRRAHSRSTIR